jgi:hypothetical protein
MLLHTDAQRQRYSSEVLKSGASGNLQPIDFRLLKNAKQEALQAQRLRAAASVTRKKDPFSASDSESYDVTNPGVIESLVHGSV